MNYPANEIRWPVGALVIHDADDKAAYMLMRVTGYAHDGRCITRYVTRDARMRFGARTWRNPIAALHDPARFGIASPFGPARRAVKCGSAAEQRDGATLPPKSRETAEVTAGIKPSGDPASRRRIVPRSTSAGPVLPLGNSTRRESGVLPPAIPEYASDRLHRPRPVSEAALSGARAGASIPPAPAARDRRGT